MRTLLSFSLAMLLTIGILPAPAAAADPTPSAPRTVRFTAGVHTGYRFGSAGAILASKTVSLARPSSASATSRAAIPGRGVHLLVKNGLFAGFWVPKSTLSFLAGVAGERSFASASVAFRAGTYLGYQFRNDWSLLKAKPRTLRSASSAHANRSAVINGRPYVAITDGIWAGYWMPGSRTTPLGVGCRAGNRPPVGAARLFRTIPTTKSMVALTFDMGGRLDPARAILDVLLLERVCTTIFATGDAANTAEGTAVLAVVRAHPELFEVANHTMHHCDLVNGGGASSASCPTARPGDAFVQEELTSAASVIQAKTGQVPAPYWRPPYGTQDAAVRAAAAGVGYSKTFMWTVDTIDWRPIADGGPTALEISNRIRAVAAKGAVALMHVGGYNTLDSLPWTIASLRAKSLVPTSISDILN